MFQLFALFCLSVTVNTIQGQLEVISREDWQAKPPKQPPETMPITPVPFVVIHHSYIPAACVSRKDCIEAMQTMQRMHQDTNGWNDIGYSFGVGSEGYVAYEGRGWSSVGAHAPGYNNRSIGICTIGDWSELVPPRRQLQAVRDLIELGVELGRISSSYKLIGHRQAKDTQCPGDALFAEISTWEHFDAGISFRKSDNNGVSSSVFNNNFLIFSSLALYILLLNISVFLH